jgi:hypothetical protein
MALTEEQQEAAANLLAAYPGAVGIGAARDRAIAIYDSLVEAGHATVVETDDPDLPAGRAYVLSEQAAESHRQAIQQRAEQAEQK